MKDIINFLDNYYEKALKLSEDFIITRSCNWNPLLILNELSIQIGHIYNVVYKNEIVNEKNRDFNNLGDELSDVFLQLIALADSMNIDLYNIKNKEMFKEDDWLSLPILFGQLNEAVMEKYDYRFSKPRVGFTTIDDFIEDRILKMFIITYLIARKYKLNIEEEFSSMLEDANGFLNKFRKRLEYISVYDDIHNFKGVSEKRKAHKLGLWHDVVGVLIFNPVTQNAYFQLKNHNHNKVNDKDLLEITVGGHLKAGESIEDCVREIKEETGLDVKFKDLIECGTRQCDMDNGMLIREFQHFYMLPLEVDLKDFKEDSEEVNGFVQMNVNDVLNMILYGFGIKNQIKIKKGGIIKDIQVSRDDFDSAFLNNGVFYFLLDHVQNYIDDRIKRMRLDRTIKRKLNKICRFIKLDKVFHSEDYYDDNGRTKKFLDLHKDNITYTIIKNNTDINTTNYIVFMIIKFKNKIITRQLDNYFDSEEKAEEYFNYLCDYINNNSNENIINNCYKNLKVITNKNLIFRLFSLL